MFLFCLVGFSQPKLERLLFESMDCLFEIVIAKVSFAQIFATAYQHLTNLLIRHFLGYESCEFIVLGLHYRVDLVESEESVFEDVNELVDRFDTIMFLLSQAETIKIFFALRSNFLWSSVIWSLLFSGLAKLFVIVFTNFLGKRLSKEF